MRQISVPSATAVIVFVPTSMLESSSAHLVALRWAMPLWPSKTSGAAHLLLARLEMAALDVKPSTLLLARLEGTAPEVIPLRWTPAVCPHQTTTLHALPRRGVVARGKRLSPCKSPSVGKTVRSGPRIPEILHFSV